MKRLLAIFFGIGMLAVFTGCSNRMYSHMTGWNKGAKSPEKKEYRVSHYVAPEKINQKNESKEEVARTSEDAQVKELTAVVAGVKERAETTEVENRHKVATGKVGKVKAVARAAAQPYKALPKELRDPIKKHVGQSAKETSQKNDGGLIYWILVIILILLVLTLIREILGPYLYGLLILVLLILLLLRLLGMI